MSQELLKRAEAMKAKNKQLEATKGSGFHPQDTDPTDRRKLVAPQHNSLPPVSDHLIPFYGEWDVVFVGPCAERALITLRSWHEKAKKSFDLDPFAPMPGTYRKLLRVVPKLSLTEVDRVPRLTLRLAEWNDYLFALEAEGIGLSGAPMEPDGTTP